MSQPSNGLAKSLSKTAEKLREGEQQRAGRPYRLDGKAEAMLVATACSTPPSGRESWTMKLLAAQLVSLELIDRISDETVRTTLKKTRSNKSKNKNGALEKLMPNT